MSARLEERWACYAVLADLRILPGAGSDEVAVTQRRSSSSRGLISEPSDVGNGLRHPAHVRSVGARRVQ
jgi:hypothetical protein